MKNLIEWKKHRGNYNYNQVKSIFVELQQLSSLSSIKTLFDVKVTEIPKKTAMEAKDFYKLFEIVDEHQQIISLELWHLDVEGQKSKLIATIKENPNYKKTFHPLFGWM